MLWLQVVVREDWVARALMHITDEERCVIEGAAATTVASIMAGLFPNLKGKKLAFKLKTCYGGTATRKLTNS